MSVYHDIYKNGIRNSKRYGVSAVWFDGETTYETLKDFYTVAEANHYIDYLNDMYKDEVKETKLINFY